MYAINPISRNVLITPDECTKKLSTGSLDSARWASCIEIAEARFVLPLLGWSMYNNICTQKNTVVTSGNIVALQVLVTAEFGVDAGSGLPNVVLTVGMTVNAVELITTTAYATLWNQALWNYVYNCVLFVAYPSNYAQFSSSGIQKNNPLDSAIGTTSSANVGISLPDLKYLTDRNLLDRISPLQDYLEWYICANEGLYPLYPACNCDKYRATTGDGSSGLAPARPTPFINIYDDEGWVENRRRRFDMDC